MQNINNVNFLQLPIRTQGSQTDRVTPGKAQQNFSDSLKNAIENVNKSQVQSDQKTQRLARGEIDHLHDVMIAAQKSSITLNMTVEIQRKVLDAYNEMMRMQI